MKIGLIGCGGMGTTHNLSLKAISKDMDIEVTAIADCRKEFLEKAAEQWPKARTYTWGMELLEAEELDVVHICLPSYLHTEHAIVAMRKGMHVFIEKPVCLREQECQLLLAEEAKSGVKVMVGQVVRSFDEYCYLKDLYVKQTFGKLKSMVMQRISGDVIWGYEDWFHDEKKSGTVVLDLHIHDLDFLRYMIGEPDDFTVKATAIENGLINQIVTQYRFGNTFITTEGIWDVSPALPFEASFRACFEEATVVYQSKSTPSLTIYHKNGDIEHPVLQPEYEAEDHTAGINVSNLGPYFTEIKYFLKCLESLKDGKDATVQMDRAPLIEGVKSVRLALQELEAAKRYIQQ